MIHQTYLTCTLCSSILLIACGDLHVGHGGGGDATVPSDNDGGVAGPPIVALEGEVVHEPKRVFMNGEEAMAYDFGPAAFLKGSQPSAEQAVLGRNSGAAPVFPMYFFYDEEGAPLFSVPVKNHGTGQFFMRGGLDRQTPDDVQLLEAKREGREAPRVLDPIRNVADYQRPIIDLLPKGVDERGEAYTGLWEIVKVIVPKGYDIESLRDAAAVRAMAAGDAAKIKLQPSGFAINCPVVDVRSFVSPEVSVYDTGDLRIPQPQIELWYRGQRVDCFMANGWESLGMTVAGDTPGEDSYELYRAEQDDLRVQTFDLTVVQASNGVARSIVSPVGLLLVPVATVVEQEIIFNEFNIFRGPPPRRRRSDAVGYRPIKWVWNAAVEASNTDPIWDGRYLRAAGLLDAAKWDLNRLTPQKGPVVVNLALAGRPVRCTNASEQEDPCRRAGLVCAIFQGEIVETCVLPAVRYGALCGPGLAQCRLRPDRNDGTEAWHFGVPNAFGTAYPPPAHIPPEFVAERQSLQIPILGRYTCLADATKVGRCALQCTGGDLGNRLQGQSVMQSVFASDGSETTLALPLDSRCGGKWMPGFVCDPVINTCVRACSPSSPLASSVCQVPTQMWLWDSQPDPDLAKGGACVLAKDQETFPTCMEPTPTQALNR